MRASTRLRVSAPTSAQLRTTLETVMTLTLRSRAMSFKRTGVVGVCAMNVGPRFVQAMPEREYNKLRAFVAHTSACSIDTRVDCGRYVSPGPGDTSVAAAR